MCRRFGQNIDVLGSTEKVVLPRCQPSDCTLQPDVQMRQILRQLRQHVESLVCASTSEIEGCRRTISRKAHRSFRGLRPRKVGGVRGDQDVRILSDSRTERRVVNQQAGRARTNGTDDRVIVRIVPTLDGIVHYYERPASRKLKSTNDSSFQFGIHPTDHNEWPSKDSVDDKCRKPRQVLHQHPDVARACCRRREQTDGSDQIVSDPLTAPAEAKHRLMRIRNHSGDFHPVGIEGIGIPHHDLPTHDATR